MLLLLLLLEHYRVIGLEMFDFNTCRALFVIALSPKLFLFIVSLRSAYLSSLGCTNSCIKTAE